MSSSGSESHSDKDDNAPIINQSLQRKTNLYVKNFGNKMNEYKLCKLFATYGTIISCKIPKDQYDRPKGFGFVNFQHPSMTVAAIDNLNGYLINGKQLFVNYFQNKYNRQHGQRQAYYQSCEDRNLFVSNLDESIDDRKLKQAFAQYGAITSAKVMMARDRSKGHGFVCFSKVDDATVAIAKMNGQELGSKPVYVALNKGLTATQQSSRKNISTRMSRSTLSSKPITIHSKTSCTPTSIMSTPSSESRPFTTRISLRLPPQIHSPSTNHQVHTEENSNMVHQYSPISPKLNQNITSNSENEKN